MVDQMQVVVNVDLVFLFNLTVDLLWLLATANLGGVKAHLWRLLLAAATGATASVWAYFPTGRWLASMGGLLLGSIVILAIAFWPCRLREAMRLLLLFLLTGAGMAGTAMLMAIRHRSPAAAAAGLPMGVISLLVVLGALLCLVGGRALWRAATQRGRLARGLYGLRLQVGDRLVELPALLDTGNGLQEPLSGLPVAVVEAAALEAILPTPLMQAVQEGWGALATLPSPWAERCRIIPFRAVGESKGMLLGLLPDGLWIRPPDGGGWREATALVGLASEPLHLGGAYRALLPAQMDVPPLAVPEITWKGETG